MANELFQRRARERVRSALQQALDVDGIDHLGLRGNAREAFVGSLLGEFLPAPLQAVTGKIVDAVGNQSAQTDVVLFSPQVLPGIFYRGVEGIFPVEACAYSIEVKSRSTATEIQDAIKKARGLRTLRYLTGFLDQNGKPEARPFTPVIPVYFAFDSDLAPDGKSEMQRYMEHDPNWHDDPLIRAICIARRGYWWFDGWEWIHLPANENGDEVVDFLGGVANTAPAAITSRGQPRFGHYLIGERPSWPVMLVIDGHVYRRRPRESAPDNSSSKAGWTTLK